MTKRILIRRGLRSQIPNLSEGELGFTTDTKELFIGTSVGNKLFAAKDQVSKVTSNTTNGYINVDGVSLKVYDDSTLKTLLDSKASTELATANNSGLMNSTDKSKLDNLINYVHPENHPASIIIQDANNRFVTDAEKSTWNSKASIAVVTTSTNGLMSSTDKTKLDGIAANANNYIHPASHPASIITEDSTRRFVTDAEKITWNDKYTKNEVDTKINAITTGLDWKESVNTFADISTIYNSPEDGWTVNVKDTDTTYRYNGTQWTEIAANSIPLATQSVDGKMSATDKQKLDLIEDGANNYIHPDTHDAVMINQDPTRRFVSDIEKASWNAKANTDHNHSISEVVNLQSTINDLLSRIASLEADVTNLKNGSNPSNTAPTLTSSFNTTTIDDSTAVSIPYNISDTEGGDMTVTLTKDGVANTQIVQVGANTWSVGTLPVGSHVLKIKVADSLGLISTELTFNLTVEVTETGPTIAWTYDFIVPQNTGVYDLDSNVAWTHTLTNEDVYGQALDGVNPKMKLLTLGVQDGTPDEPGQELPRDGFDVFTAPSMHGAFSYDADLNQIYFASMAMNPYYFRIVKYV